MHLDFTPEHDQLRKQIRSYYADLFTPEVRAAFDAEHEEMGGPVFREIVGRMGRAGWLGVGWPVEYGGQGFTPIEQFIFWDETYRARAPLPIIPVNTIGPTIMRHGSEEQKRNLLPAILRGELFFGVGYTEPNAGTPSDGSMHAMLPPEGVRELLAKGWGEMHPLALTGQIPETAVMVFGPRDEGEVDVILDILSVSYDFARGAYRATDT